MANRRMFSKRIISSGRFLKMPISSQALYFHLGLNADDDGVVEAYNVICSVQGCTEDDLKVLVSKGFVQVLNEDLVSYITDWTENNNIRADRKIDSIYKDLLLTINPDVKLIEKRQRADVKPKVVDMDDQWTSNGQPMDGIGKDRLGEDSVVQDSVVQDRTEKRTRFARPSLEEVQDYINEKGYSVNAEQFIDYYESNGWKVGKNSMKDWKAAVRTWEARNKNNPRPTTTNKVAEELDEFYQMATNWAQKEG